jgi:transcriptional antiterminator NusG
LAVVALALALRGIGMKHWVIIFAHSGAEEKLIGALTESLTSNGFFPFIPVREMYKRKTKKMEQRPPFPGYLFLQTDIEADLIADKLFELLRNVKHIYSILHYGDDTRDVVVRQHERECLQSLFDDECRIRASVGFIEGDKVYVTEGALVGKESMIVKINRHNRTARIAIDMFGDKRDVVLSLEIISKTP